MTPLEIRNSALNLYVSKGILLVTSVFAFCPPSPSENGCFGVYHIGQNRYHDST